MNEKELCHDADGAHPIRYFYKKQEKDAIEVIDAMEFSIRQKIDLTEDRVLKKGCWLYQEEEIMLVEDFLMSPYCIFARGNLFKFKESKYLHCMLLSTTDDKNTWYLNNSLRVHVFEYLEDLYYNVISRPMSH
ncbi:zinc finger protein [Acrasis kona]|uniref:Zinc finger protein n=1 Tax=Acrasis kona TaxID=1008807 RepID=A0AAW2ZGD3_9EUKA